MVEPLLVFILALLLAEHHEDGRRFQLRTLGYHVAIWAAVIVTKVVFHRLFGIAP